MDREYFLNARNAAPPLWNLMTPATEMSFPPEQIPDRLLHHPSWDKSTDQYTQFDSALSSMASSPVASNSGETFAIRELIGKLGNICNAGEISPQFLAAAAAAATANSSCYSTPLSSPPKMNNLPVMDQFVKENVPNLRNSVHLNPGLPSLAADPGFAERAAKFSCFGSRSFNGRTSSQFGLNVNNPEFQFRSSVPLVAANSKLPRVSSSPLLKVDGSPPPPMAVHDAKNHGDHHPTHMEIGSALGSDKKFSRLSASAANSNEESSVSEQIPSQNDSNSRKRKAAPRGKAKEIASPTKETENPHDSSAKKIKQTVGGHENGGAKTEEGTNEVNNGDGDEGQNQAKNTPKPPEPPKDYIHVRARRGQATDSHSLAERVRREKISERMKLLQDLVPGCNKVTGKALMLDEIINYVQSLQRQVEFLSMKLATVNPRLDFDMNSLLSKDMNQSNVSLGNQMYPMESTASAFFVQQQQSQQAHNNNNNIFNGAVDPLPPPVHGFSENFTQFPAFCEDDLHSIVHMGFSDTLNRETTFQPQTFQSAQNQASEMKVEL